MLLSFCLFFLPVSAKSVAYKKKRVCIFFSKVTYVFSQIGGKGARLKCLSNWEITMNRTLKFQEKQRQVSFDDVMLEICFGSQILVTTGWLELQNSYVRCS